MGLIWHFQSGAMSMPIVEEVVSDGAGQAHDQLYQEACRLYECGDYKAAYDSLSSYVCLLNDYVRQEQIHHGMNQRKVTLVGLFLVVALATVAVMSFLLMSRKNRQLTVKMEAAHSELDDKTRQLLYQSRTLDRFKSKVMENDKVVGKIDALRDMTASQIIRSSDSLTLTDADIENLERLINECDNGLVDRLRELSPRLSAQDIALCCLLRLKVDKRNIAALLCVSDAALRKRKYRLRTDKLGGVMPEVDSLDELLDVLARRLD